MMSPVLSRVPNQSCFVWDDNFFPYAAYLSIKSAARNGGFDRIYLLKTPDLDGVPTYERLRQEVPALEPVNIDLRGWLEEAGLSYADELVTAHGFLKERRYHSAVSDLLRALWLYLRGGVYLDTDTLTIKPFTSLLGQAGFLAQEHILVSSRVFKRNSRWRYVRTAPLTMFRSLCSRISIGVSLFRVLEGLYVKAEHNAVMGFAPGHPFVHALLGRIAEKYPQRPTRYPLLGPDAIQDLTEEKTYPDLRIYPPAYFSPLGPTMTYQYFHLRSRNAISKLRTTALRPETTAVHWSNNSTIAAVTPQSDEDVRRLAGHQLFSRLALEAALGEVPQAHARFDEVLTLAMKASSPTSIDEVRNVG
jgi:hypothetical protein